MTLKEWIAALRSGNYKQVRGMLKGVFDVDEKGKPIEGFCCLGVGLDVAGFDWKKRDKDTKSEYLPSYMPDLADKLQIGSRDADGMQCLENVLAHMNDEGDSFEAIADRLEVHGKEKGLLDD
jgi:hypothetical protein